MVAINLHNFLVIVGIVMVAAVIFGLLAKTALGRVPILGQVISLGAKAA